jgi:hercynine metabolism protein
MSWLDELERSLEQRLDAFLKANPHQDILLRDQHLQDRQRSLEQQRLQLQHQAHDLRRQLLNLAEEVRNWTARSDRARTAGAQELAKRADQHIQALMNQGRDLWTELNALGATFQTVEQQLDQLMTSNTRPSPSRNLEQDWALFEAHQELDDLKRQHGLS